MGFLSNLFGKPDARPQTYVASWVEKRGKEIKSSGTEAIPDTVFYFFVLRLSKFGSGKASSSEDRMLGPNFQEHYVNDPVFFELGCHMYGLADRWLALNRPAYREIFCGPLAGNFVQLFSEALKLDNVADLFHDRLKKYEGLYSTGGDWIRYLSLGVLIAKDGHKPGYYELKDEPTLRLGATESMAANIYVGEWLRSNATFMPELLQKAIGKMEKQ